MSDIQREILDDLPTQRFQENVSRAFRKQKNTVDDTINSLQKTLNSLQKYADLTYTFTTSGNTQTLAHNLGSVPTGWFIIDITGVIDLGETYNVRRVSWDSTNLTLNSPGSGGTIYNFNVKVRVFI